MMKRIIISGKGGSGKDYLRKIMEDYGAQAIVIMDSTGTYLPRDVRERISLLKARLNIKVGFHAHNNLGVAISNAMIAVVRMGNSGFRDEIIRHTAEAFGREVIRKALNESLGEILDWTVTEGRLTLEADLYKLPTTAS
jgi:dephospho-CoA kinase